MTSTNRFSGSEPSQTGDTAERTFVGAAGPQAAAHDATGPVAGRTQDTEPSRPLTVVRKDGSVSRSRPPFEAGNTASLRHGARSPRAIAAKAAEVHSELVRHAPWLSEDRYAPAVARYLEAAARERLLGDYISTVCGDPRKGPGSIPVRLWESAASTTRLAAKLASDLGLDPIGHGRLQVLAGAAVVAGVRFDLARAWADSDGGDVVIEVDDET